MNKQTNKAKYEIDMCNGPILKKMLFFTLPLMCSSILQLLFNAADIVVVGRFAGDNSLAAVGSNTSLINLLTNLFIGLSIGANVMTARYYGAKQKEELKATVHTAMLLSIYSGIILTIVGIIGARQILIWMQTPDEVLDLAVVYLRIYFLGMTATMIYNFGSAILRAVGDTKRPLYYLSTAGVVNVILNLIFVIAFRMDVAGVGLATVISQCISAFLVVRCLIKEESDIQLHPKELRIHRRIFFKILQIGLPAGFQGTIFSIANVVIQSSVNSLGAAVVTGASAQGNYEAFVSVAMTSFAQTAITFVAQHMGAKKYKRMNHAIAICIACVSVISLSLNGLFWTFRDPLLRVFIVDNEEALREAIVRMSVICPFHIFCGILDVFSGSTQGLGASVSSTSVSLVGTCGFRLVWIATIFKHATENRALTLFAVYPASWIFTLICMMILFFFMRHRIIKKNEKNIV